MRHCIQGQRTNYLATTDQFLLIFLEQRDKKGHKTAYPLLPTLHRQKENGIYNRDENYDKLENMRLIRNYKEDTFKILPPFQTSGNSQNYCTPERNSSFETTHSKKHKFWHKLYSYMTPLATHMA